MSAPTTEPAAAPPLLGSDALRIVLFGMPAAGKSSLLGALAQSAQTQEHLLHGRLTDLSRGLAELQQRLYEEHGRPTSDEVVPYPTTFEPFAAEGQPAGKLEALVIDCDGRVANDLLTRRRSLSEDSREGTLAREVLEADTLILAIDASAPVAQVDADFVEFGRFLHLLERSRGQRSAVGGLPVFLVLTKCDLLAGPEDSPAAWLERIEERKRQVDRRFRDFLARKTTEEGPLPFGRIDLHLWATAVKRPALAGAPARPREPYGVAELFRQCLDAAREYRQRRVRSSRRLLWTVAGVVAVLASMLSLTLAIPAFHRDEKASPLQIRIDNYRAREGQRGQAPSGRLQGSDAELRQRIGQLAELLGDPGFEGLPPDYKDYVRGRHKELEDYRAYWDRLARLRERKPRSEEELRPMEDRLRDEKDLAVPRAYRNEWLGPEDWGQTEAGLAHAQLLKEIKELRRAATEMEHWYGGKIEKAGELWTYFDKHPAGADAWRAWHEKVGRLLAEPATPPFPQTPTYETVAQFPPVGEAQRRWREERKRLERLRDLSAALGLGDDAAGRPAVLQIPGTGFGLKDAADRVRKLREAYPNFESDFILKNLPTSVTDEVRRTAQRNYQNLLESGRAAIHSQLEKLNTDGETPELWAKVRAWLESNPAELADWRVLATTLARLQNAEGEDPVAALVRFLKESSFPLELKRLTLSIPDDIDAGAARVRQLRPVGNLSVRHEANKKETALTFETSGGGERDLQAQAMKYAFKATGEQTLTYRPGDKLSAVLSLKDADGREWVAEWLRGRSRVYQLDHLVYEPVLYRKDQGSDKGQPAAGMTLRVTLGKDIPPIPDLMPVVILKKR